MPAGRGRRPSGQSVAWVLAWILVGAIVIAGNVGSDLEFGDGALRLDASDRVEVRARYSRDVPSPCRDPRIGGGRVTGDRAGGDRLAVPVEAALCRNTPTGLTGTDFSYVVRLWGESTRVDTWTVWGLFVAQLLSIMGGAYAFVEMLSLALRRSLFTPGTVLLLRVIAACVALGGLLVPYIAQRVAQALLDRFVGGQARSALELTGSGPGVAPFVIVAMVLAFAEVWRRGIALRDDVEATI